MSQYQKFYSELNDLQRKAVDAIDGPILVLAGPGTGKTQLLSVRAASIIKHAPVGAENILILTYTNAAAKAMKERLAKVIGPAGYDVEVGTFHSFANSIIQESVEASEYVGDRIPMTDVEQAKAIEYILDNTDGIEAIRPFRAPYNYLSQIRRRIGEMKKDDIKPEDLERYLAGPGAQYRAMEEKYIKRLLALSAVYKRYEDLKRGAESGIFDERGRYDFDDMILFAIEALKKEPGLLQDYRRQYRYIMVDEFQDTNGAQMDLLFTLCDEKSPNLCCVGDDDQSIYRFQGASVANFKRLQDRFPGINTIQLKDNYRSTSELIKVSRAIISMIPPEERVGEKKLNNRRDYAGKEIAFNEFTTEEEELLYVVKKVMELAEKTKKDPEAAEEERRNPYNSIAVLVRKRDHILKVIDAFLQSGIPYATDGKEDIGGEGRVRQLLDVLELADIKPSELDAKDTALYRVLAADYMEIPQSDILKFIHHTNEKRRRSENGVSLLSEFLDRFSPRSRIPSDDALKLKSPGNFRRAGEAISALLAEAGCMSVHKILMDFIKASGIYAYILREFSDKEVLRIRQLRALGSFVNMVKSSDLANPAIRLDDFISEMRTRTNHGLSLQGDLVTLTQSGVRIYTAHGSKGMEFRSVIMPFCLQNKSWPVKPAPESIQLPFDLFKTGKNPDDKETSKRLSFQDETRLFYVATTRAKSTLILTASPSDGSITTSYVDRLNIKKDGPADRAESEESLITRSTCLTPAEDPFIGTEAILRDMISNMTLNPTRLNNYISCRRRFLYNDVLKLPGPKRRSLVFGNCVHKALEETYRAYKESGKFPSFGFFEREFARELRFQGVDKVMERECLNRMKTVQGWFKKAAKDPVMPIDLEKKLMVTVGENIIFTGKYDKVEWCDENKRTVKILDYKTGKPDDHVKAIDACADLHSPDCEGYLRQLVAYKLLFERDKKESGSRKVRSGELVFIEPLSADIKKLGLKEGDYVTKEIEVTDAMVSELEEVIKKAWSDIKRLRFEKLEERDKKLCGNCDFETICWGVRS